MDFGIFKPILTSFLMPPMAPLLLALLGMYWVFRKKRAGPPVVMLALVLLWVFSCHGIAVLLAANVLPQFEPVTKAQFKTNKVQAIVILGGGLLPLAPEYGPGPGQAQPSDNSASRLRFGLWLARHYCLPIAFSGGIGWAVESEQPVSEAAVAARVALEDYGVKLRWVETKSRDTAGNARELAQMLHQESIHNIALVTDAWHMPRAMAAFEQSGFKVTPAPTGYVLAQENVILEWLPSARGMQACREVLREGLGLALQRLINV